LSSSAKDTSKATGQIMRLTKAHELKFVLVNKLTNYSIVRPK